MNVTMPVINCDITQCSIIMLICPWMHFQQQKHHSSGLFISWYTTPEGGVDGT